MILIKIDVMMVKTYTLVSQFIQDVTRVSLITQAPRDARNSAKSNSS